MKIAYLLGSLNRGGAETLALDVLKEVKNTNLNLIVIHRKKGLLYENFKKTDSSLIHLHPHLLLDISYFIKLRKVLRSKNIQIVHCHQKIDAIYAFFATVGLPIKLVLTFHGHHGISDNFILRLMVAFIMKRTDLNIYVSHSQIKYYMMKYNLLLSTKQKVVYNGISFKNFEKNACLSLRKEFSLPEECHLIGTVGNFTSGKDQKTICRFLVLLHQQSVDFYFIFVGEKSTAEPWLFDDCVRFCEENGLANKVSFLGSRNDVPNILSQLDAFIYSTAHDTFGIAVVEAMAAEVPVFVNDWGPMIEITDNGKLATIYQSKNENDLLNKFRDFLNSTEGYKIKAMKAADIVKTKYCIENHLQELKKVYQTLITT